ncbi:COMM domain-containing protein, partial [Trichonephila clavipes]
AHISHIPEEIFFKLLIKCPVDRLQKLIHHLVDLFCGQKTVLYESFADVWTLLEWWDLIRNSEKFFLHYYSSSETLTLASDKMAQINEPRLLLNLDISGDRDKTLCLDLSKEELKMLIETMDKANKAVQDFIVD